jgi:hypothetical protein
LLIKLRTQNQEEKMKLLAIAIVTVIATGCTSPKYGRIIKRTYDAEGLVKVEVTEAVEQMGDPTPLHETLKKQTYKK